MDKRQEYTEQQKLSALAYSLERPSSSKKTLNLYI